MTQADPLSGFAFPFMASVSGCRAAGRRWRVGSYTRDFFPSLWVSVFLWVLPGLMR